MHDPQKLFHLQKLETLWQLLKLHVLHTSLATIQWPTVNTEFNIEYQNQDLTQLFLSLIFLNCYRQYFNVVLQYLSQTTVSRKLVLRFGWFGDQRGGKSVPLHIVVGVEIVTWFRSMLVRRLSCFNGLLLIVLATNLHRICFAVLFRNNLCLVQCLQLRSLVYFILDQISQRESVSLFGPSQIILSFISRLGPSLTKSTEPHWKKSVLKFS